MSARELYQAGKLDEALEALGGEVRDNPTDGQRRTFLFELLCFAGKYDRAESQLDVLADGGPEAALGGMLYRGAVQAERTRQEMFRTGDLPGDGATPEAASGTLNGKPFTSLVDGDSRIGPRLEVFAAGKYLWIPFEHLASVRIAPPKRLRDLLWAPALVRTGPGFRDQELGEVLLPVLAPLTWRHPDGAVRLGRATEWEELEDGGEAPVGQKLLLVDDDEIPILEVRDLELASPAPTG